MDKTTLSFQSVIEIDNIKKKTVVTIIIDTTINGETIKRKHIFDQLNKADNLNNDQEFKIKLINIILEDI